MSGLTLCNYCSYKLIRRRFKGTGAKFYQRRIQGWIEIYVVLKGEKLNTKRQANGEPSTQWTCAYMELTASCAC